MGVALRTARTLLIGAIALRTGLVPGFAQTRTRTTTRDKVYSSEQAARGGKQFAAVCATCHDPAKIPEGKKPAPQLIGAQFLDKWQDRTLGELMTTIATTMPNDGSVLLTDDDAAALVAYVLQANGFPDGPLPLKSGDSSRDIVIVK